MIKDQKETESIPFISVKIEPNDDYEQSSVKDVMDVKPEVFQSAKERRRSKVSAVR